MVDGRAREGVAFYARGGGRLSQWWTLLHPPYTLWHLSYVALGAAVAPRISWAVLAATIAAFFLAVGLAAHALDELSGRPLDTAISDATLRTVAAVSLSGAVLLGLIALPHTGLLIVPFIVLGVVLVLAYNLELFGGRLHTDVAFAAAWGGFPAAVGFLAQAPPLARPNTLGALCLVLAATGLSYAQRRLSTPARLIRRRTSSVDGVLITRDGVEHPLTDAVLLAPLEAALKTLSVTMPLLAAALLLVRV